MFGQAVGEKTESVGRPAPTGAALAGELSRRIDISVSDRLASVEAPWRELESQGTSSVYQRFEWVETSLATLDRSEQRSAFVVTGTLDGAPAFLLPLAIRGKIARELTWAGGSHANFNVGLYSQQFLAAAVPGDIPDIMGRIGRLVRGVGFIKMCCQPESWRGIANPMLELPRQRSVNQAYMMNLSEGFDALLSRGNAKRKRKKFKQQARTANLAGGYRLFMPQTTAETDRVLNAFLEQKSARLRQQGKSDVFSSHHARRFLLNLASRSRELQEPLLRLFGLEIGGEIRAVFGGGVHQRHLSGYFSSISLDEMTAISPGEMLLYLVAEQCANEGMAYIDLGAGDERYKRSWCDMRIGMFDVIMPTSLAGVPFAAASRFVNTGKRIIRESPQLWSAVGAARQVRSLVYRSFAKS